jgi:hypothetical protein
VILTSSAEQRDLAAARECGARFYIVKPPRAKTLAEIMTILRMSPATGSGAPVWVEGDLLTESARQKHGS